MNFQPLMTATQIKTINPFINNDIDDEFIDTTSVNVQNTLLRDTLGWKYYESIYNQVLSGGTTGLTSADQIIWDNYLQYIIGWGVTRDLSIPLMYQQNSDGIRVVKSDHSDSATDAAAQRVVAYWQNLINERRVEMAKYMKDHNLDYPLYWNYWGNRRFVNQFPIHRAVGRRYGAGYGYGAGSGWNY